MSAVGAHVRNNLASSPTCLNKSTPLIWENTRRWYMQRADEWRLWIIFFCPILEKFCPLFEHFAQMGSGVPRWGPFLLTFKFRPGWQCVTRSRCLLRQYRDLLIARQSVESGFEAKFSLMWLKRPRVSSISTSSGFRAALAKHDAVRISLVGSGRNRWYLAYYATIFDRDSLLHECFLLILQINCFVFCFAVVLSSVWMWNEDYSHGCRWKFHHFHLAKKSSF